ncbi:hypothetical protein Tco_0984552 [Tanacetum coccineum]
MGQQISGQPKSVDMSGKIGKINAGARIVMGWSIVTQVQLREAGNEAVISLSPVERLLLIWDGFDDVGPIGYVGDVGWFGIATNYGSSETSDVKGCIKDCMEKNLEDDAGEDFMEIHS